MRVLMLGWEFPPHHCGGLGPACQGLVSGLTRRGVEIVFVLPRLHGEEIAEGASLIAAAEVPFVPEPWPRSAGVEHLAEHLQLAYVDSTLQPYQTRTSYTSRVQGLRGESRPRVPRPYSGPRRRAAVPHPAARQYSFQGGYGPTLAQEVQRYAKVIAEWAGRESFDWIHAHDWMTFPAGLLARAVTGKPLLCHFHSCEADRSETGRDPGIETIEACALERADRVACVSEYTRRRLVSCYGGEPAAIDIVPNAPRTSVARDSTGSDSATVSSNPRPEQPVVLFLGRLTHQKGPDLLLRAAAQVLRRAPHVRFRIAGEGDMREALEKQARELGLGSQVEFLGFVPEEAVADTYAQADVFVLPSRSEPFGLTPLEALAQGTPVILSQQCGVAEWLESAPQVDPEREQDLAEAILELIEKPQRRLDLLRAGLEESCRLSWEASADRILDVYRSRMPKEASA